MDTVLCISASLSNCTLHLLLCKMISVLEDVIFSHIPPEIDECDGLVKENTAYDNVLDSGNVLRAMTVPDTSKKGEKLHKIVGQ